MYKGLMFQNQLLTSRLCRWIYRGIHVHHLVLIKSQFNSICISSNLFQVCWIKASSYWMGQPLSIDVVYIWAIVSHNPQSTQPCSTKRKSSSYKRYVTYKSLASNQCDQMASQICSITTMKICPNMIPFFAKVGKNVVECQINSFKSHCFERSIRGIKTRRKCSLPFEMCVGRLDAQLSVLNTWFV